MGEQCLERGDPHSAVDVGITVIGCEPSRESAHSLTIRAHVAAGNRFDAYRCFERYRDLLWHELSLEPSPELVDCLHVTTAYDAWVTLAGER